MKKWKINRVEITGFKVFERFEESFESDFIVLDGPNGFGKTSVYDAIQLLFCGEIPRILALSKAIKVNGTKQFSKNLYRNNNSDQDVVIKVGNTLDRHVLKNLRLFIRSVLIFGACNGVLEACAKSNDRITQFDRTYPYRKACQ